MTRPSLVSIALLLAGPACAPGSARVVMPVGPQTIDMAATFCNPIDIDYPFAADTPSRRDIADPVITLAGDEYQLTVSNISGSWHSRDLATWQRSFSSPNDTAPKNAAAGSTFRDRRGNLWRVATESIGAGEAPERRLGIAPAADSARLVHAASCDAPQFAPDAGTTPGHNGPSLVALTSATTTTSSVLAGHPGALAFDGNLATWWSAATGGVGEWLSVDLGGIHRLTALQVNFAEEGVRALGPDEDSYQQYIVESSLDGVHWTPRLDESQSRRDSPHHYVQLDTAHNARFIRITNVHAAAGGTFAVRELRLFESTSAPAPARR